MTGLDQSEPTPGFRNGVNPIQTPQLLYESRLGSPPPTAPFHSDPNLLWKLPCHQSLLKGGIQCMDMESDLHGPGYKPGLSIWPPFWDSLETGLPDLTLMWQRPSLTMALRKMEEGDACLLISCHVLPSLAWLPQWSSPQPSEGALTRICRSGNGGTVKTGSLFSVLSKWVAKRLFQTPRGRSAGQVCLTPKSQGVMKGGLGTGMF